MEQRRLKNYRVLMQARRQTQRMMREQEEALARLSDKSGGRPMKGSRRSGPVQEAACPLSGKGCRSGGRAAGDRGRIVPPAGA